MNVTSNVRWLKKLPPWLYKLGAQAWIDYEYPRHLFIETTAACNLTCSYCPRERRGEAMDYNLFKSIVDEGTRFGRRSFSLHLFGEPLLYPRWFEAVRYLKDRHHTVLLTTNGTRLNSSIDAIIEANPDQVLWSWRPEAKFTPKTKERLRRWGKFRVRFIKEVTPPEAYEEWKDWPNVEGRQIHNYGGNINLSKWRSTDGFRSGIRDIMNVKDVDLNSKGRWPCYHLWLAPAVAWNGDILICCADPHHKEVVGRFPQMTVAEAWKSEKLTQIRNSHLSGGYGGICEGCDVWKQYPDLFFNFQKK